GALYPALRRLERKGWLKAEWGETDTGREAKYYELTPDGRARLASQAREWGRYVE
ncbi:MAG: PadR family transcriptional regulator, partial [Gammaproteobacteria bacterium]|nr:PadR family transcriptional regulator [Gammaproteobacteria bacterium]